MDPDSEPVKPDHGTVIYHVRRQLNGGQLAEFKRSVNLIDRTTGVPEA